MATAGTKRKANTPASASASAAASGGGKGTGGYEMPWVEKYRPRNLDDVVGNDDTLVRLRAIAVDGNMPNLILCGPPGTGKVRRRSGFRLSYGRSSCRLSFWDTMIVGSPGRRRRPLIACFVDGPRAERARHWSRCVVFHVVVLHHSSLTFLPTPSPRPRASTRWQGSSSAPPTPTGC